MRPATLSFAARWTLGLFACGALATIAMAHHGWAGYDESKPLTLTGTIRDAGWENPHGFVRLQVDNGKGKTWTATLAPPSRMETRGLKKTELKVGATATVVGSPSKTNPDEVKAERITVDGKTIDLRR